MADLAIMAKKKNYNSNSLKENQTKNALIVVKKSTISENA